VWDVDALANTIPMPLAVEWMAFWIRQPFGDDWRRTARLSSIVAAAAGAKSNGDLEERFLPTGGRYRGLNQTESEMLDELRKIPQFRDQLDNR